MNSSINFSKKTRSKKKLNLLLFIIQECNLRLNHLKKLSNPLSEVSCHYFIGRKGRIKNSA